MEIKPGIAEMIREEERVSTCLGFDAFVHFSCASDIVRNMSVPETWAFVKTTQQTNFK
jgi:hypothetical protein